MQACRRVIMLGTAFQTRGGIAAVVNSYRAHGLFSRWPVRYIETHCDGGALRKLATMMKAVAQVALELIGDRRAVFHIHTASRASFWRKSIFMSMALAARCPFIVHLHGGGFVHFYESCGESGRALIRFFLDRAACIVVLSEQWRRWVSEASACPRVVCIPNPVGEVPLMAGAGRRRMILFMGRLERHKGIYDLLQAVSALRLQLPEVTLVCAGDGDQRPVRRFCDQLGIADAVTFTGWIGEEEKRVLLQRAAAFVLPSHVEAMPMSLLEAMAAKVPVVAAAVGGVPEVITDGVDGLLFQPGDIASLHRLLCRLLHDRPLAGRLAVQGRRTVVARYAADRVLAQLGSVYTALGLQRSREPRYAAPVQPSRETA